MYNKIKDIPINERPKEKVVKDGVESLNNYELLGIILNSGTKDKSAIELGKEVLFSLTDFNHLKELTIYELMNIKGIGLNKAINLIAVIEFGKRLFLGNNIVNDISFLNPKEIFLFLKPKMVLNQECFVVLFLDSKCKLKFYKTLFIGSLSKSLVHPREIFKWACKVSAMGIIVAHNHPSGDPTPSKFDIDFTIQLYECSKLMQIELLDHIIVGNTYYSFKEKGYF